MDNGGQSSEYVSEDTSYSDEPYSLSTDTETFDTGYTITDNDDGSVSLTTNNSQAAADTSSAGDPVDMFDHLYAEPPPHLQVQKNELKLDLENSKLGDHHD